MITKSRESKSSAEFSQSDLKHPAKKFFFLQSFLFLTVACALVLSAGRTFAATPTPSDCTHSSIFNEHRNECLAYCTSDPELPFCNQKQPEKKKRMTVKQYKAMVEARAATAFIANKGADLVGKALKSLMPGSKPTPPVTGQPTNPVQQGDPSNQYKYKYDPSTDPSNPGSKNYKYKYDPSTDPSNPGSKNYDPSRDHTLTDEQIKQLQEDMKKDSKTRENVERALKEAFSVSPFGEVSGSSERLESGSYVDVTGLSAVLGLAARRNFKSVAFTAGLFFEYGTSRFNTHNGFDEGDIDGKGHATAMGGGVLARLDFTETMLKGLYFEGAFRLGGIRSDWSSDDLRSETGRHASYDLYSPYHGAILGLGYIWEVTDSFKLDFYGQWLWSHVYGGDAYIVDVPFEFDDVDSHRLRAGVRADWNITEQLGIYAGAAWEHEFDGRARATADGVDTPSPSIKGDTGVFDLGFAFKPTALPGFTMQLGATASAGKRHGVGGNFMVKYEF